MSNGAHERARETVEDAALATQKRLSMQYSAAALLVAIAGILLDTAWISLVVWAIFAAWLVLRLRAAKARLQKRENRACD